MGMDVWVGLSSGINVNVELLVSLGRMDSPSLHSELPSLVKRRRLAASQADG